ncbi:MAG TPA: hypothetical protein VNC39_01950 [Acidocella sp.]|jgi:hypothetical protein|uniref:hypothetical protein n=1 Tax=Acidocella sp. TaxID=50710 RepID=UPI002C93ED69|nr:hypothetical protein [Acidocella sp.]HVE20711.1 hypothetical protein [Acidocella sp.]
MTVIAMAKAGAKKGELKLLSGADVAAWFEEYMEGKQRRRPVPSAEQCVEIVSVLNEMIRRRGTPPGKDKFLESEGAKRRKFAIDLKREGQKEGAALTRTISKLIKVQSYLLEELIKDFEEHEEFYSEEKNQEGGEKPFKRVREFFSREMNAIRYQIEGGKKLQKAIDLYFFDTPKKRPDRSHILRRHMITPINSRALLRDKIREALVASGRGQASFTQGGPATYVYKRCIESVTGQVYNKETLARELRRIKADVKKRGIDLPF